MAETRFYLQRTVTEEHVSNVPTKLKFNEYNASFDNARDEAPTFYTNEDEATQVATALNTIYKVNNFKAYVDVFKEDVEVKQVTFNDPQHANATEHVVEIEETTATEEPTVEGTSTNTELNTEIE